MIRPLIYLTLTVYTKYINAKTIYVKDLNKNTPVHENQPRNQQVPNYDLRDS